MADEHSRSGTPLFDVQKAQDDSLPVSHRPRIEVHRKLYLSYGSVKFGLEEGQVTQKQLALLRDLKSISGFFNGRIHIHFITTSGV